MKRLFLHVFICLAFINSKAQWVSIPDSNFGKWLISQYPSCMKGNAQVGFQIDTGKTLITSVSDINCSKQGIKDLTGIRYFKSLKSLSCNYNELTFIPNLPLTLSFLYCENNHLTSLPSLPVTLYVLSFANNQLTALPNLPASLGGLTCSMNQLTSLPSLPNGLKDLSCQKNMLTSLPILPDSLRGFDCGANSLTSLPALPASLRYFGCSQNLLTVLPVLPDSLKTIDCRVNQLSSLPTLPNSLELLYCDFNQLTALPTLPNSLRYFFCTNNQLSTIPSLPDTLIYFYCDSNPNLYCLPKLNTINEITFSGTGINCLPNYPSGNVVSFPSLSTVPVCDMASGCVVYWNISGNVHEDTAVSCIQDSLAAGDRFYGIKVILSQGGVVEEQMYSSYLGEYSFGSHPLGNYEVNIDTTGLPIEIKCPVSGVQSVTLTATDSIKENVSFGLGCKAYDIGVRAIHGRFRIGQTAVVNIETGLICSSHLSATLTTQILGSAKYVGPAVGALTPTSVVGNTLTYAIADMSTIHALSDFNIVVQTDSNAVLGSSVCVTVQIQTSTPDYNPDNDSLTMCFYVVNSFDPNEKIVFPKSIYYDATWLYYTIQFQNTGSDTAYNVVVSDTLSANLDIESFQYLASSHSPSVKVKGREAIFTFTHINLLDSLHNEPKSHGWLQYRIKTKAGLPLHSEIRNTASIYFDLNTPVVTNTTINTLNALGITDVKKEEPFLHLYPNPTNSILNISTNSLHSKLIAIYDASGRKVSERVFTSSLDISNLSQGMYLLEVKSDEGIARGRFVRQ